MNLSSLLVLSALFGACHAGKIKLNVVFSEGGELSPLSGAKVQCFDEDFLFTDDRMTNVVTTGEDGMAELSYQSKRSSSFWRPCRGWDCWPDNHNPDIYCIVSKPGSFMTAYTSTLENRRQDRTTHFGTIRIYPDRVARGDAGSINGCGPASVWSGVRDVTTFLTGFGDECNNHDLCFNSCSETQNTCDNEFLDLMVSNCHDKYDTKSLQDACRAVAVGIFEVVQTLGGPAFEDAQQQFGCV